MAMYIPPQVKNIHGLKQLMYTLKQIYTHCLLPVILVWFPFFFFFFFFKAMIFFFFFYTIKVFQKRFHIHSQFLPPHPPSAHTHTMKKLFIKDENHDIMLGLKSTVLLIQN